MVIRPALLPRGREGHLRSKRSSGAAALAAGLALALLACGCSRSKASSEGSGRFRMAIDRPVTLDPVLASQPAEQLIVRQVFDALVGYEATTAAVMPGVAQSWTISGDNTVYTFHLLPDARFSDGEAVTAESFVRGMTRALSPALVNAPGSLSGELDEIVGAPEVTAGTASTLAGAVALSTTTLQIRLSVPDAEFLLRCGDGPFTPLPKASAMAGHPSWAADPLGNGPFMLAAPPAGGWLDASQIVLVPNPDYAGTAPKIAAAVLKVIPDVNAAYEAWMKGQVDWAPIPPTASAHVQTLGKKSFLDDAVGVVDYLTVGIGSGAAKPGTDPEAFREAISLAINRATLSEQVFDGAAHPARGLVPPVVPGSAAASGDGPNSCAVCDFQPTQARQLLAQSGIAVTGSIPLVYPAGLGEDPLMAAIAQDLQQNLGIEVVPTPRAAGALGSAAGSATLGVTLEGVSQLMNYPGADDFLSSLLSSEGGALLTPADQSSLIGALATARAVVGPAARAAAYADAERAAMQTLPVIPLLWPRGIVLARLTRWSFLSMNPFGEPSLRTATPKG